MCIDQTNVCAIRSWCKKVFCLFQNVDYGNHWWRPANWNAPKNLFLPIRILLSHWNRISWSPYFGLAKVFQISLSVTQQRRRYINDGAKSILQLSHDIGLSLRFKSPSLWLLSRSSCLPYSFFYCSKCSPFARGSVLNFDFPADNLFFTSLYLLCGQHKHTSLLS